MISRNNNSCFAFPAVALHIFLLVLIVAPGCGRKEGTELFHRFPKKTWERFNLLSFEIPIQKPGTCNIYLFARFDQDFQFETLDFNMIMNTPSGEERIREYQMQVRSKTGDFSIECGKDFCQGTILLKKEINLSKPGILKIAIENLTPRINTEGVQGVGIRVVRSGK